MLAISPGSAALRRIAPAVIPLSAPSLVEVTSGPSDYGVTVSWVPPEMHPFGFLVELYNETTPASPEQYFAPAEETFYQFLSLTLGSSYSARVTTLGDGVAYLDSAPRASGYAVSPQPLALDPVSDFNVSNDGSGYLTITWIDPAYVPYTMRILAEHISGSTVYTDFNVGAGFQSTSIDLTGLTNEEVVIRMWNLGDGVNWRNSSEVNASLTINGAPPGSSFDPTIYGTIALRLRAQGQSYADGQSVGMWGGLIGGNATQSTSSSQPEFQENVINGKPALYFDGVDDDLRIAGLNAGSETTWFFVLLPGTTVAVLWDTAPNQLNTFRNYGTNQADWWDGNPRGDFSTSSGWPTILCLRTQVFEGARTLDIWVNNTHQGQWNSSTGFTEGLAWGAETVLGSVNLGGAGFFNGHLAELILYSQALDDTTREQVVYGLAGGDEYGISL